MSKKFFNFYILLSFCFPKFVYTNFSGEFKVKLFFVLLLFLIIIVSIRHKTVNYKNMFKLCLKEQ